MDILDRGGRSSVGVIIHYGEQVELSFSWGLGQATDDQENEFSLFCRFLQAQILNI